VALPAALVAVRRRAWLDIAARLLPVLLPVDSRAPPGSGALGQTQTPANSVRIVMLHSAQNWQPAEGRGVPAAVARHDRVLICRAWGRRHLHLFESAQPGDSRPREAIEHVRAWVRGEVTMMRARAAGGHAMGAARNLRGAARHAAYAAGQAGAVAHVAAHELGAAAYAIKAARASAPERESEAAGRLECRWQRDQLPKAIRELVLDDQRLRNDICWSAFNC
jgi:hypothetical protein